jgi:Family of unknown function (DUF5675)
MNLTRNEIGANGTFGILIDDNGNQLAVTAEHSYQQPDGSYAPKIPSGTYTCQKGMWTLEHITTPFQAFQIMNVPNHTDILLHVGNYPQIDSAGCVLLGQQRVNDMITNSRTTFEAFMNSLANTDSFTLIVSNS